jgi:cytochrome c oxidase subunit 2
VAKGRKYVMQMTSTDVIHSFTIPSFYVKQDVVPGLTSRLWFEPTTVGEFVITCNEYCGDKHSGMLGIIQVMEPADFDKWKNDKLALLQKNLIKTPQAGQLTKPRSSRRVKNSMERKVASPAHNVSGAAGGAAPSFKGLYGKEEVSLPVKSRSTTPT